jgi:hypothetical protein
LNQFELSPLWRLCGRGLNQREYFIHIQRIKGTVRPDWIGLRVVLLQTSWLGHQPLFCFKMFNFNLLKCLKF